MRKFHLILLTLAVAVSTVGCHRIEDPVDDGFVCAGFSLKTGAIESKAVVSEGESSIARWCVFASRNGEVVAYATQNSEDVITLRLNRGDTYDVAAVANYPTTFSPASLSTVEEIENLVFDLSDNGPGRLIMFGQKRGVVAGESTTTIEVERLIAKVTLEGFSIDFSGDPSLAEKTFTLNKIYMINVYGKSSLKETSDAPSADTGSWYNKRQNQGEVPQFLVDEDIDLVVGPDAPYEETHTFYVYPNLAAEDSNGEEWSPRFTRLVIEATLDFETRYYFVSISGIRRNRVYRVRGAVLCTEGNEFPDVEDSVGGISGEDIFWEDLGKIDNDDISGEDIEWGSYDRW